MARTETGQNQLEHGHGQVISGKKNSLIYELLNERMSPWIDFDDQYIDDDMQFGIDNSDR